MESFLCKSEGLFSKSYGISGKTSKGSDKKPKKLMLSLYNIHTKVLLKVKKIGIRHVCSLTNWSIENGQKMGNSLGEDRIMKTFLLVEFMSLHLWKSIYMKKWTFNMRVSQQAIHNKLIVRFFFFFFLLFSYSPCISRHF